MEIESRKRHFNEDTSKKKYEKNLASRVDLGIPQTIDYAQTDTAGPRPSFSQKRSKIRDDSRIHERLQKSLRTYSVKNNMVKLQSLLKSTHGQNLKKTYSALIVVLEHLIIPGDYQVIVNDCARATWAWDCQRLYDL